MITNAADWVRPLLKSDAQIEQKVAAMLQRIAEQGDAAIEQFSQQLDQQPVKRIKLKSFDEYGLDDKLASAIKLAAARINRFAEFQKQGLQSQSFEDEYGTYGQQVKSIERVGAYIPGGRYPLISTALMTLIPAKVAGSSIRIAVSPSDNPAILAAASLAGATEFIQLGGVQGIGALTYGYQDIQPVDVIVGPGNAWTNEAKKQVQGKVSIDGLAGPSELLAICDGEQPIDWLALDALAQAEHDPMACSLIVSDDKNWLESMSEYLNSQAETKRLLDEQQIELIYAESENALVKFSEAYAPEHLMLCHKNISSEQLSNYGSLFIGANSAVALGDYITGPNHTLPTLANARQNGGLNVNTFLRVLTTQQLNEKGRKELSNSAISIADAEGLVFHSKSMSVRR
ncbi:MAG: histidinol dehydrogenase [Kangiellaceae bacterium]|nr:histidinol dehydrogenase [Kangiellaceae bacterium]